ncbi:MAG: rRNA maturation RNase YbeY [Dehalococcoidales bacterium]|nr:MAG: rRNA maturation RNase YbeY [Dehalococcoidales bacterium]
MQFEAWALLCYDFSTQMEINVLIEEDFGEGLEADWLKGVVEKVLLAEGVDPEIELGLVITGQEKVQQLNLTYLGRDGPTDVLAFTMAPQEGGGKQSPFVVPPDGVTHLGEVIISYPQAAIQAGEHGHSVEKEIAILIIHGVLHLLGCDHEEPGEEREMRAREEEILGTIEEIIK